jgi:hypothetical protein
MTRVEERIPLEASGDVEEYEVLRLRSASPHFAQDDDFYREF